MMLKCVWVSFFLLAQADSAKHDLRCGSYCLYVSLKALDFSVGSYEELEGRLGQPTHAGYSLAQLAEAAQSYGAETLGVQTTLENLKRRPRPFACIAFVEPAHFVTLTEVSDLEVYVVDPPRDYRVPLETFESQWGGKALLIAVTPLALEEALERRLSLWTVLVIATAVSVLILGFVVFRRVKRV